VANQSYAAAYGRGVEHLKRSEYAQAVEAFTEAIALDSDEANAYVGRGLAHRGLDDEAAAARDEQAAKNLGGPDRSAWDRLVKRAKRQWHGDLTDPTWPRQDPLCRDAFLIRQWTWQVYNGGLVQWVANGYGRWAADLAKACDTVGTESARDVADIVRDVARVLAARRDARDAMVNLITTPAPVGGRDENLFDRLADCEARYGRVGRSPAEFVTDVEEWFDRNTAADK
jgi:tetratricopeptide (TPR) repeat protein